MVVKVKVFTTCGGVDGIVGIMKTSDILSLVDTSPNTLQRC